MNEISLNDLLNNVKLYNESGIPSIEKAYHYAESLHEGQFRQSGEPYISHPLNVAYILSEMHADTDTICAGLLHDTLEDTEITKEAIAEDFNKEVANLVDGVTKISKLNFSTENDQNMANTRKIITGITTDARIIIIKLADRLHNMRTLQFKSEFKQKENSMETMDIFVPLAYYIGAYRIKSELEDLSLQYLYPDKYKKIEDIKLKIEDDSKNCLQEMLYTINNILSDKNIPSEIKVRTKNIYGIYKRLSAGERLSDIHDLFSLKVMVDEIDDCYKTLRYVHNLYHPINSKFKDYICNPKTNMYSSLHTTVFGEEGKLVQTQIRTFDMDKIASFGLTAYFDINKGNARKIMQEELKNKYQFFSSLLEINSVFADNQEFVNQIKNELFSSKVYIYGTDGKIVELPKGSTIIDYAFNLESDIGYTMIGAVVNDEYKDVDYILKNNDRVRIIRDDLSFGPREEWITKAVTTKAKKRIKEFKGN